MQVRTFLALRAVCVANAFLMTGLGVTLFVFMQHPAGVVAAAVCVIGAGLNIGGAQWLDRNYERRR